MTTQPENSVNSKDKFTSNISHELKTPLTSIIGFIELLKKSDEKDKKTRDYFYDVIDSEAQRLLHLIDDILLLSKVENSEEVLLDHICNVNKEIKVVLKFLLPLAQNKNIHLKIDVPENITVNASDIRVQQLLTNLIGNAIKYNTPNGQVVVNAYSKGDFTVICVKDTGIGIESKHINKIFDRFYRINDAKNSDVPGSGLGLSIVKDIVTLYKGTIEVNSQVGNGSEFIISLPNGKITPGD